MGKNGVRMSEAQYKAILDKKGQNHISVPKPINKVAFKPVLRKNDGLGYGVETIYGKVPSKSNNYKVGKGGFYKSKQVSVFETDFKMQCKVYRDANIDGEFEFYLDVYFKNPASDLDGAFKGVLDCLQQVNAITNDKNCKMIFARKFTDKKTPRIEFEIKTI
jgi:Holliday junction resolvase RusA-like endonuclease